MSNVVEYKAKQYPIATEGIHQAVLVDVINLGEVPTKFGLKQRILLLWALEERDKKEHPILVVQRFNKSLHKSSKLFAALSIVIGHEPGRRFDLDDLIGANAILAISHSKAKDDRVFMNVDSISRVPTSETLLRLPEGFRRKKDRSPGEGPWPAVPVKLVRGSRPAVPAATPPPAADTHGLRSQDFVEARGGVSEPVLTISEQGSRTEISDEDIPF